MRTKLMSAFLTAGLLSLALPVSTPAWAQDSGAADKQAKQPEQKPLYDEKADAQKQIEKALAEARKENKRVLLQWGANWCGWCTILDKHFKTQPGVRRELQYEYIVAHIDVGKFDKNVELAKKYGANFKEHGVPFLTVLSAEGKPLANQETGSLEIEGKPLHDPEKVLAFLKKHEAPRQNASAVLSDALAKADSEGKRVFLHFGAPWCGWCHRLEDWMETEEAAQLLGKDFIDCKIDIDRMIGGKEMLAKYRKSEGGGIPWFCFVEPSGQVVVTSDGPTGNVGCPWTDEEIAAFGKILSEATQKLDAEQVEALLASLKAFKAKLSG
jgi:thiol:disulfide interchange protein